MRCPYCQRTVTAPAESMLPAAEQIPTAKGIATRREFEVAEDSVGATGAVPPLPPRPASNRAAVAAFFLILASMALYMVMTRTLAANESAWREYERILKETMEQDGSPMSAASKFIESQGGTMPGWMISFTLAGMGSLVCWLGSIVFGIWGAFQPFRRGLAVGALCLAGMMLVLSCMSALGGAAG